MCHGTRQHLLSRLLCPRIAVHALRLDVTKAAVASSKVPMVFTRGVLFASVALAFTIASVTGQVQLKTPQLVTFNSDDTLTDITTLVQKTSQYRMQASGSARRLTAATARDPLAASLSSYEISLSTASYASATLHPDGAIVTNTTAEQAMLPQARRLLTLTDQLHEWLANPANEASIKEAVDSEYGLQSIEQVQYDNATMVCEKLLQYSDDVVSNITRRYCCSAEQELPPDSLSIICTARIHQDVAAFMLSASTSAVASSLGSSRSTTPALSPAPSRRLKASDSGDGSQSGSPCSESDLDNLQNGILPKVSCCFHLTPVLELCLQVSHSPARLRHLCACKLPRAAHCHAFTMALCTACNLCM